MRKPIGRKNLTILFNIKYLAWVFVSMTDCVHL